MRQTKKWMCVYSVGTDLKQGEIYRGHERDLDLVLTGKQRGSFEKKRFVPAEDGTIESEIIAAGWVTGRRK